MAILNSADAIPVVGDEVLAVFIAFDNVAEVTFKSGKILRAHMSATHAAKAREHFPHDPQSRTVSTWDQVFGANQHR